MIVATLAVFACSRSDRGPAVVALPGGAWFTNPSPSWTAEGDEQDATFRTSVASAGDVDGDGYGDVIVGAAFYDGGEPLEGQASVYLRAATATRTW